MNTKKLDRYFPELQSLSEAEREKIYDSARHQVMVVQGRAGAWTLCNIAFGTCLIALVVLTVIVLPMISITVFLLGTPFKFDTLSGSMVGAIFGVVFGHLRHRYYIKMIKPSVLGKFSEHAN